MDARPILLAWLEARGWSAAPVPGRVAYRLERETELCPVTWYLQLLPEHEELLFYIAPKLELLEAMLAPVAETICRLNHGLRIGNFELDFDGRRVSFKSAARYRGIGLTPALIENTVQPALTAFDELFPALAQIIAGLDSPQRAVRKVEYGGPPGR
jgi:hypothetical protein